MTLTVKLDPATERRFEEQCRRNHETKSAAVKRLITGYITASGAEPTPFELARDLIDGDDDGVKDASITYKRRIQEKLRAKRAR